MVQIGLEGAEQLRRNLAAFQKQVLPKQLDLLLNKWGKRAVDSAKRNLLHKTGRREGTLANSIDYFINGPVGDRQLTVGTATVYAPFVEGFPEPPRRHFLPFRGHPKFAYWAKRVLGLSYSQIDTRHPVRRIKRGTSIGRPSRTTPDPTPWQKRKRIKGFLVGGPQSIRPFLGPSLKQNIPKMINDLQTFGENLGL